jgi:hypothetical protein
MPDRLNLVVDTMSEVYDLLKPWITHEFWDLDNHDMIPNSVYVFGRKQFVGYYDRIRELAHDPRYVLVFDNAAEGSTTMIAQLAVLRMTDLVQQGRILLISGGALPPEYPHIVYDHFLSEITNYDENITASRRVDEIFTWHNKPHTFLFLNGRSRPHRKYLWERLRQERLLDRALWTMLDSRPAVSADFTLPSRPWGDRMAQDSQIRTLPYKYEYPEWRQSVIISGPGGGGFIKNQLFDNKWGEIYLQTEPYRDTYFSLVTETVYETNHSFRTEKIAKPLLQGHPWICAANPGFYRDMRNLGFRSFGDLIDESFDTIEHHQTRMDRIMDVIRDLVSQDLNKFIMAARATCIYNQQHLLQLVPDLRQHFPRDFFGFLYERLGLPQTSIGHYQP